MNILQHNIERFGMVTVMDVVFYEVGSSTPILLLDTLKMTNINTEGSNKEVRGGIGNDMLISYDYGRTANIEMQDALLSPSSLALLWGKDNVDDIEGVFYEVVETHEAYDDGLGAAEITLDDVNAVDGTYDAMSLDGLDSGTVEVSGGVVTQGAGTLAIAIGTSYKIFFQAQDAEAKQVTLTNDDFPSALKLVGTTFVIDESTGAKRTVQIEIPKFKMNSNFSFSMDAEGDASVFDFSGVALSHGGEIMKFKYLG